MERRNDRIERKRKTKERDLSGMVSSSLVSVHFLLPTTRKDKSIPELPTQHDTVRKPVFPFNGYQKAQSVAIMLSSILIQ